jgi:excisionase family DNA binding protein
MAKGFNPTEWITTTQAADLMGYDYAHVRLLARKGRIQSVEVGRDWLINRKNALAYAKRMEQLGTSKHDPSRTGIRRAEERGKQ